MAVREMRIMIAGGGTGGHAYPGIALYRALARRLEHVDVLFVGAKSGVEGEIFRELGYPYVLLGGRGVRGASLLSKALAPFVFLVAATRGVRAITTFRPDVVIGTGGFASVAAIIAAVMCRRPRVLQEQNSIPGMTNRLLSRFAQLVLLSYGGSRRFFASRVRCAVVGNPLRMAVVPDRAAALEFFGLRGDLPTVLIFGGSRGARSINTAAAAAAGRILAAREVQFVFLAGRGDFERLKASLAGYERLIRVYPFLEDIQHAYSAADVAIARAGASSVFELAAFGVPTVFVPYPYAADDHQKENVAELQESGAARVVEDAALDGDVLETIIVSLLDDTSARESMAAGMRGWAKTDADELAAKEIIDLVQGRREMRHAPVYAEG